MESLTHSLLAVLPYDPSEHFQQNMCGKGLQSQIPMQSPHTANNKSQYEKKKKKRKERDREGRRGS